MSRLTPHCGGFSTGAATAPSDVTAVAKGEAKAATAATKEKNRISEAVDVVDGVECQRGFEYKAGWRAQSSRVAYTVDTSSREVAR